jgi:hypothetical protein
LVSYLHRADILLIHLRGLQPHALTPDPPSSGQATTIWVPHDPGVDPPLGTITQARRKSTFMGHVDPASTAVYLTITGELLDEASRRFEAFAEPAWVEAVR